MSGTSGGARRTGKRKASAAKKTGAKRRAQEKTVARLEVYDVQEEVRRGALRATAFVRRHPWESIGVAALAGAFLARLFSRWRRR